MARYTLEERETTAAILRSILTEENTDALKRAVKRRVKQAMPRWARWIPVGRVLDDLLPEVLLDFLIDLLGVSRKP